jgi:hypothetical protein
MGRLLPQVLSSAAASVRHPGCVHRRFHFFGIAFWGDLAFLLLLLLQTMLDGKDELFCIAS